MMTPVVAIVGYSDSGKTRVATYLVKALTAQGCRVAAVKHCHHGQDVDRPNSDTDLLFRAGAATVVASSPGRLTRFERADGDSSLESIVSTLGDGIDIVIAEGFKASGVRKVLVVADSQPPPLVENVIATVGNHTVVQGLPRYRLEELDGLVAQLSKQVLGHE